MARSRRGRPLGLVVLLVSLGGSLGGRARAEAPEEALVSLGHLVVTASVGGRFADPACTEDDTLRPAAFARTAAAIGALRREHPEALIVDTGGLLEPHGVARFALTHAPDALGDLIAALGYRAVAFGESDLHGPRANAVAAAALLRSRGIPMVATNLECGESARALCEALVDASDGVPLLDSDGRTVAFLAFLTPEALERTDPESAAGLRIAPLEGSVRAAVRAARAAGAEIVIASIDDGGGAAGLGHALALAEHLAEADKPDLMLLAGGGAEMLFARPLSFRPAVTAAPPGGAVDVALREDEALGVLDLLVRPLAPVAAPAPAVAHFVDAVGPAYCAEWGGTLVGGRLEQPIDRDGLRALAAASMRAAAGAEVALLHEGSVTPGWSPVEATQLRGSDVHVGLPYDDPLVVATVPATWLRDLARARHAEPGFEMLGLTLTGTGSSEKVKVNGRDLELRGSYRVVTTRFLASGGHRLLPPGPEWAPLEGATLRRVVVDRLSAPRPGDPREGLPDPQNRLEWTFRIDTDATFGGSAVRNPGDYTDTQFQRANTTSFGVQSTLFAGGISRLFALENTFVLRYRLAATGGSDFQEGDDRLSFRTTGIYRGLRSARPAIYVPEPIYEVYWESELTVPAANPHRHMLLRPTLGLQFALNQYLGVKMTGGFETELLYPHYGLRPGVGAQVVLKPWRFLDAGTRNATLQYTVDYFVSDLGGRNRRTLRGNFDLAFRLTEAFGLGLTLDLYGVRERGDGFSMATNATANFRVGFLTRVLPAHR
jgi:hypothetical protein